METTYTLKEEETQKSKRKYTILIRKKKVTLN